MNSIDNAGAYASGGDFDDRLLLTYLAFALFSPSEVHDVAENTIHVMQKATTDKNKRRLAFLCNGFAFNYFLPLNVVAFSIYIARCMGFVDPQSFSLWLMVGFSGYFLLGMCIFLWGLTRTKNWIIVFLTFLSLLPYSRYYLFRNYIFRGFLHWVIVDLQWGYFAQYAPRNVLTLLFLATVILMNKRNLQKYVIPLSTIMTFWHLGQAVPLNGFLFILLLFSFLVSKLSRTQLEVFKKPLQRFKHLLPYPNRRLMIHLAVNIAIGTAYFYFLSYNLEYVVANWQSPLPSGLVPSLIQYLLYSFVYCKIVVEVVTSVKTGVKGASSNSHDPVDTGYFTRILFTCLSVLVSMAILIWVSEVISPFLGESVWSASIRKSLLKRYASNINQTVFLGVFLASFLVLRKIYKVVNRYVKAMLILIAVVVAGIVFVNFKSCKHLAHYLTLVSNSHRNLVTTLTKIDRASENEEIDLQKMDVFFWRVIKHNFLD